MAQVIRVCVILALGSLLFNIALPGEMEGHLQVWSFLRKTGAKALDSGTAWAALAVYAGWRSNKWWQAFLAGVAAAVGTLLLHYLAGVIFRICPPSELTSNGLWFAAAFALCGPLGLIGWMGSHGSRALRGLAVLVVPAGAVLEPFLLGHFQGGYPGIPWPERYSFTASGILLVTGGVTGVAYVLWRFRRTRRSAGYPGNTDR